MLQVDEVDFQLEQILANSGVDGRCENESGYGVVDWFRTFGIQQPSRYLANPILSESNSNLLFHLIQFIFFAQLTRGDDPSPPA